MKSGKCQIFNGLMAAGNKKGQPKKAAPKFQDGI